MVREVTIDKGSAAPAKEIIFSLLSALRPLTAPIVFEAWAAAANSTSEHAPSSKKARTAACAPEAMPPAMRTVVYNERDVKLTRVGAAV